MLSGTHSNCGYLNKIKPTRTVSVQQAVLTRLSEEKQRGEDTIRSGVCWGLLTGGGGALRGIFRTNRTKIHYMYV